MSCWDRIKYWCDRDAVQIPAVILLAFIVVGTPIAVDYYTAEPINTDDLETMVEYVGNHPEFKPHLAKILNNDGDVDENEEIEFWRLVKFSERTELFKKIVTP